MPKKGQSGSHHHNKALYIHPCTMHKVYAYQEQESPKPPKTQRDMHNCPVDARQALDPSPRPQKCLEEDKGWICLVCICSEKLYPDNLALIPKTNQRNGGGEQGPAQMHRMTSKHALGIAWGCLVACALDCLTRRVAVSPEQACLVAKLQACKLDTCT